jgi:hypothetical protein
VNDQHPLSDWLDGDEVLSRGDEDLSPAVDRRHLADELVIHGLLSDAAQRNDIEDEQRITRLLGALDEAGASSRKSRLAIVSSLAALAACVLIAVALLRPTTVSAAVALERMIESVSQSVDRAYRLNVREEYANRRRPANLPEERWRVEASEDLDGAHLYVGGVNRYVFVRKLLDGRTRVTGCDGNESWAFREDGPVHVSQDMTRFRGGLPGQRQSLGFTDLYSQLTAFRHGYEIELTSERGEQFGTLVGQRKSSDVRGPKRVEILFDLASGTIHRMVLNGLPRGHGGPKSVEFVLVSEEKVDVDFYSHKSHHDGKRRIKREVSR